MPIAGKSLGLLERELAEHDFRVHFDPERAEPHKIVNDLARVRAVVELCAIGFQSPFALKAFHCELYQFVD